MKKLFLDVTFATLCAALLAACGGDSGSSADSLDESSSSSEMDGAESSDSEDLNSNGSEGSEGESSGSEGGESSGSSEGNSSGNSEGNSSGSSEEPESSSEGASSSSEEPESSSEEASSSSEEPESSSSEDVESSGSGEGSSASVPGGSSDASTNDVVTGTLTDTRDGQTYRTVKIGDQVWMAENLNYAYTGVPYRFYEEYFDETYTSDSTSWCYDNDPANCAKYGRLYTWAAAMDSVGTWSTNGKGCGYYGKICSPTYPVRGVCPKGWHLPSYDEWDALSTAVGGSSTAGTKLKFVTGWSDSGNGTDTFGFSALPAGLRYGIGDYDYEGDYANFWSSTEGGSLDAYTMGLYYGDDNVNLNYGLKNFGFSVRCLKD